jgi:hypothetical protein
MRGWLSTTGRKSARGDTMVLSALAPKQILAQSCCTGSETQFWEAAVFHFWASLKLLVAVGLARVLTEPMPRLVRSFF